MSKDALKIAVKALREIDKANRLDGGFICGVLGCQQHKPGQIARAALKDIQKARP